MLRLVYAYISGRDIRCHVVQTINSVGYTFSIAPTGLYKNVTITENGKERLATRPEAADLVQLSEAYGIENDIHQYLSAFREVATDEE